MASNHKTKKTTETQEQKLSRWFDNETKGVRGEVMDCYGEYAGNGPRLTVDGITFEKVIFADCPKLEHLGDGYCVIELDDEGNAI